MAWAIVATLALILGVLVPGSAVDAAGPVDPLSPPQGSESALPTSQPIAAAPQSGAATAVAGVPEDPTEVFLETFELGQGTRATALANYVGTAGQTHTADPYWLNTLQCNGVIVQYRNTVYPADYCYIAGDPTITGGNRNNVRRLADVLGQVAAGAPAGTKTRPTNASTAATQQNHAVTAHTAAIDGPDNAIQFQTSQMEIDAPAPRFYTASVDVAESSCEFKNGVNNSRLQFTAVADGNVFPLSDEPIRACTDQRVGYYTSPVVDGGWYDGGNYVAAGRFVTDSSHLFTDEELKNVQIVMRNETGAFNGNDAAFDNIRLVDVTPQLSKSFAPINVPTGGVSTLTLTITNTSELAAKRGWSFTDSLPEGLVIADPANADGTCDASVTATSGSSDVTVTAGNLVAGQVSCTITVDVTSDTPFGADPSPQTYQNCAENIIDPVGVGLPDCAAVTFYSTPALSIQKTSDAPVHPRFGDVVTYKITATNTGDRDYAAAEPAVVFDDLTGVLDDADYNGDGAASRPGAVAYAAPLLSWSGAVPAGQSVDLTYTVTLHPGGDGDIRNVAWQPKDPQDPQTPACDPPVGGVDAVTGEPCAEHEYLVPSLTIEKSATSLTIDPASGDGVAVYRIDVTNTGPAGAYGPLVDAPAFSPGVVITGASWTVSGDSAVSPSLSQTASGPGPFTLAGAEHAIAAGATHTYTVTVTFAYTGNPVTAPLCDSGGSGTFNSVSLPPGQEAGSIADNSACTSLTQFQLLKVGPDGVPLDGSSWALSADSAANPGAEPGVGLDLPMTPVIGQTGLFMVAGLPAGVYWLTETAAPPGHELLAAPITFEIDARGVVTIAPAIAGITVAVDSTGLHRVTVTDNARPVLPFAGGSGGRWIPLVGSALLAAAAGAAALGTYRRRGMPMRR